MNDYPAMIAKVNHVEPVPRRVRAFLGGQAVLDTTQAVYVWEWPSYPQYYIPVADIRRDLLVPEEHIQHSSRGQVELHGLRVGGTHRPRAARLLAKSPIDGLSGTVRFEWAALDAWFEEDERVFVHPRNPYVRVDALRPSPAWCSSGPGMLTAARLREDIRPAALDWITALRAPQVKALVRDGALQLELFDQADLAEISSPDYPGERLVACKNPFLEAERARKRESLLQATEADLEKIAAAVSGTAAAARHRQDRAARRPGAAPPQGRQALHHPDHRHQHQLPPRPGLHRRRSRTGRHLRAAHQRQRRRPGQQRGGLLLQALGQVERAFRAFNTDLDIRPIRHRTETRVRAYVFLRMLSYYITWHMQARLAPLLFTDDDKPAAQATRPSPVAPAARSPRALAKAAAKHTEGNLPVHSFDSLLTDLATICLNQIQPADPALPAFRLVTTPTPLQRHALDLLTVSHRLGTT